jgi:CubicO group peptidase (beta-lactamase class C family)
MSFPSSSIQMVRSLALLVGICSCSLAAIGQEPAKSKDLPAKAADRTVKKLTSAEQPKSSNAPAASGKPPADVTTSRAGNFTDPGDLEAFFDGVVNVQLESKHIAGAVVAVVVGDKLVFSKGYGYGDVAARRKVDPEKTMFRIASISKLFTWTAVMQQVEEGKLDLDADINKYLKDVKIPATFDQPITLRHLLTHTPGFDDYVIGLFGRKPEDVGPLAEVLRTQMPTRVRPPGVLSCYSNHGTALAGYAVACVSGLSWEDYIEQRILKPLGMDHTLVRQPAEDQLPADVSKGYKWEGGQFEGKGFEYVPVAPAGCISTTATDAAKFMLAHLNDGGLGERRILKPETARRMREPLFRHNPKAGAMCYGFMELERNGKRLVGHGGDTLWFHSLLQLIPEHKVGLFVSYNTETSGGAREDLLDAFMRRYFPKPDPPRSKAAGDFRERAKRLAQEYGITRYPHSGVGKLLALAGVLKISVNDDDTITISRGDTARRYVEIEPYVFRELDGPRKIVFQEDDNGRIGYLFPADAPPLSAVRREWYELSDVQLGLLAGCLGIFASALLFWPAIAFSVRGLQSPRIKKSAFSALFSCLAWLLSVVSIAFVTGVAIILLKDPEEIVFGLNQPLKVLLAATQISAVLSLIVVLGCLLAWTKGYWRLTGRVHYSLVALAGIAFTWFLYHWDLLTFGFSAVVN